MLDYQLEHSSTRCRGDGQKLFQHFAELRRLKLWPLSEAFGSSSISALCRWAEKYEYESNNRSTCGGCTKDLEELTRKAGRDAMQSFKGLCLDCIKLGVDETGEFRECVVHKKVADEEVGSVG